MTTIISIGPEFIIPEDRHTLHSRENLERMIGVCIQAGCEPVFRCGCHHPLIPFTFGEGFLFRRASRAHLHETDCGFFRVENLRPKRTGEMFKGLRPAKPPARSQGLGVRTGGGLPRMSETSVEFATKLLCTSYRTAHVLSAKSGNGKFTMPSENDFIEGVRRSIGELDFNGFRIDRCMEANGLEFRVAAGYLPPGALELWTETSPLFVTRIPLQPNEPAGNEVWKLTPELLKQGVPINTNNKGGRSNYSGHFFAIGASKPNGEFTDCKLVRAFHRNGVYGQIDSATEAKLARYFDSLGEDYFRVSDDMDIPLFGDLLQIPSNIALNLRHKMDFVRPGHPVPRFVEATSYEKGDFANKHSQEVVERVEHYLNIGLGRIEVELWQLFGPVPELVHTVRSWYDLQVLREILSRNSQTKINV